MFCAGLRKTAGCRSCRSPRDDGWRLLVMDTAANRYDLSDRGLDQSALAFGLASGVD